MMYIRIGTTNVVKLSSDSVICTFSGTPSEELNKSCSITYGPCQQQQLNATISDITNPVQVTLSTELKNGDCYFLNSSNGTFTVLQWGVYCKFDYCNYETLLNHSDYLILANPLTAHSMISTYIIYITLGTIFG